jgi:hypothetical protein
MKGQEDGEYLDLRGMKGQEDEEYLTLRSFVICTAIRVIVSRMISGQVVHTHGGDEKCVHEFGLKSLGGDFTWENSVQEGG